MGGGFPVRLRTFGALTCVCAVFSLAFAAEGMANCPAVPLTAVISLRGSGEDLYLENHTVNPGAPNAALLSELKRTSPVPFTVWPLAYPAVSVSDWRALRSPGAAVVRYIVSLRSGRGYVQRAIWRAKRCGHRVVLIGYSQGAHVIHYVRRFLEPYAQQIRAIVLFGSPRFLGRTWTAADTGFDRTRNGIIFEGTDWDQAIWRNKVLQFCNPIDVVCQGPRKPWSIAPHLDYEKYSAWSARFVRNRP